MNQEIEGLSVADYEKAMENARNKGTLDGTNAGAWAIDGNTSKDACKRILDGIGDCDSEIMDRLPWLDLSGQWADGPSESEILDDILSNSDVEPMDEEVSELIEEYRTAYDDAMVAEVERICLYQLS